ncbi:hypothetical protein [uncultured Paracoccus sp.]|uniref:hypothetical protein n=1 Tax=uncultured Paracoccus sp. TaxID=189685 RepID=UPI002610859F|nr:hypothetical protein [uncultured Paracoccus sp.]
MATRTSSARSGTGFLGCATFTDGGYAGDKLKATRSGRGDWTLEITKRSDTANGSRFCRVDGSVERTFAWLRQCHRLAKDEERSLESSTAWTLIAGIRLMTPHFARYCDFA